MLVLKRNIGSCFLIIDQLTGEQIKVMVTKGERPVSIGIEASQRYRVIRDDAINRYPIPELPTAQ